MNIKLKIGQKLGVSAAVGMALVLALVVTSRISLERIDGATASLERAASAVDGLSATKLDLRDLRGLFYQAGVSTSAEAVDKIMGEFDTIAPALSERVGKLAATMTIEANRERMARAKPQVDAYLAGWRNAVRAERDIQLAKARLIAIAKDWHQELGKVTAGPLSRDAAAAVEAADGRVAEVEAGIWQFLATGDEQLKASVPAAVDTARHALGQMADQAAVPALVTLVEQHRAVFDGAADALARRTSFLKTLPPLRIEVTRLVDETLASASALTASLNRDVDAAVSSAETTGLLLGGLTVVVLIGSTVFGFFSIGRPISRIAGVLEQLAGGNRGVDIPFTKRSDEVGETARAANVFKANLIEMDRMAAEQKAAEARAEAEKKAAMHQLADSFEGAVGGIVGAVSSAASQLQGAAQTMSAAAEQTNQQSLIVASASEQASSNVQTVASAAEELASSVSEIGRRVNESAHIAAEAARDADATASKVGRLSQAAQKIGDIVGLISTIAGQTNLLALNATIEAARAGEAGRGFAVVASEVKSLADQTAKATAEISSQIEEIQSSTADSANAIGHITETIRRMNEIATAIASAVEEQGAATSEIARNVQQASAGTAEVSSNIAGVTQAASDSSAASAQVLASAGDLATQSGVLRGEVAKFLATVRAA